MTIKTQPPRVLVADDDPVTLAYFQRVLEQLGCNVVAASSGSEALRAASGRTFDLLLLDRRMPDFGGRRLLAALRGEGVQAPAIATSADIDATTMRELTGGGFHSVVAKPLSSERLLQALQPLLPTIKICDFAKTTATAILDDAAALAASGDNSDIMHKLRSLLVSELESLPTELNRYRSAADSSRLRDRLHRLKASCGFCGARALALATIQLDDALRHSTLDTDRALAHLLDTCRETLNELQGQGKSLPAGR